MRIANVVERLNDNVSMARRLGRRAGRRLQSTVEERPLATLAVAFGIGYLLSKFMKKR